MTVLVVAVFAGLTSDGLLSGVAVALLLPLAQATVVGPVYVARTPPRAF